MPSGPRIGSRTRPMSCPPSISSTFACTAWKPRRAAILSAKVVKPPETSAVQAPLARIVASSAAAPGISVTRSRIASSRCASSPARSATRRASEPAKSSSPRIAASVTAAISARRSRSEAISSISSSSMIVLSMSATSRRLRRAASSPATTLTSIGSGPTACVTASRHARAASGADGPKRASHASPGESQRAFAAPPPRAPSAAWATASVIAPDPGAAVRTSVKTSCIEGW